MILTSEQVDDIAVYMIVNDSGGTSDNFIAWANMASSAMLSFGHYDETQEFMGEFIADTILWYLGYIPDETYADIGPVLLNKYWPDQGAKWLIGTDILFNHGQDN